MHRVIHFGSVLQAYALQKMLLNMGYDNEIIDYKYPNEWHLGVRKKSVRELFSGFIRKCLFIRGEKNKVALFIDNELIKSRKEFVSPESLARKCPKYDVYLTGSDQVWNTDYLKGDTSFFFSFLPKDKKKISYAASFGRFSFKGEEAKKWLSYLHSYKFLSVRERKAKEIIQQYIGLTAEVVLDPTLLLTKDDWACFSGDKPFIEEKYILVYVLTYAWQPFPYALNVIEYFERELGYKVVVLEPISLKETKPRWTYLDNLSPHDFVNLIRYAALVITTSFHGTAFAVNMEVPFYSIVNESKLNDDRISSLCNILGLEKHLLYNDTKITALQYYDFTKARCILDNLRTKSIHFLSSSLSK